MNRLERDLTYAVDLITGTLDPDTRHRLNVFYGALLRRRARLLAEVADDFTVKQNEEMIRAAERLLR